MRCPSLSSKRYKCQLLKNANKRLSYVNGWASLLRLRRGKYILFSGFEERLNKLLNNFLNYSYLKPAGGDT